MTSVNTIARNLLLAGALAVAPMLASAAIVPVAANTNEPVVAVTLPATIDPDLLPIGAESGGIEYRDEHGNLVEPEYPSGEFDRSHLARVDGGDETPLPVEVDADGDGFVDIIPLREVTVDPDTGAIVEPISAEIAPTVDRSWLPGLVGGAALGSLATLFAMRRRGQRPTAG
jgi:hypothetical protein